MPFQRPGAGAGSSFNPVFLAPAGLPYTARSWDQIFYYSTGGSVAVGITMPANPTIGDQVSVGLLVDCTPTFFANSGQLLAVYGGLNPTDITTAATLSPGGSGGANTGYPMFTVLEYVGTIGTHANCWLVISSYGMDAQLGESFFGPVSLEGHLSLGVVTSSTFNGTVTLPSQPIVCKLNNTAGTTWTMPTSPLKQDTMWLFNQGTSTIALAGPIVGATTIPPRSTMQMEFDGTNWRQIGGSMALSSNTAAGAVATTQTPTSGTLFTPNASQNCVLSFAVATAGTYSVSMGVTLGTEVPLITSLALPVGAWFSEEIPANWKVIITGTIANLQNIVAVSK